MGRGWGQVGVRSIMLAGRGQVYNVSNVSILELSLVALTELGWKREMLGK
jgi:hypothetical protein